jgi:predicted DNA-binding transcriptional regulator YafY
MRRADRLFQIVQLLRRRRTATTAAHIAAKLEISERTVYRDIRDLILTGTPIDGEAGVG